MFGPLQRPSLWPPPGVPENPKSECFSQRVPLIGWFVAQCTKYRGHAKHCRVLESIEKQIVEQLVARPRCNYWPNDPQHQKIADILGSALGKEKGISPPSIHPDDPVDLLFWGACDDMTPLAFDLALHEHCGFQLSFEELASFRSLTARELIDYCVEHAPRATD